MDELLKALAPFPLLEGLVLGMMVAAGGFWAMRRGMQESRRREDASDAAALVRLQLTVDEREKQWAAHERLGHIHENSFKIVDLLKTIADGQTRMLEAINRFNDTRRNKTQ